MKQISLSVDALSRAISELLPGIFHGIQLDFFTRCSITQTQFMMLVAIHSFGKPTMGELSHSLAIKMPTATGIIDRLVRRGYAKRVVDPKDRRKVVIELTPRGLTFIKQFQSVVRKRWAEVLVALTSQEVDAFSVIVKRLLIILKRKTLS